MPLSESRQAASSLSEPLQQGTLAYVYRRSVFALQNLFLGHQQSEIAEREPLLSEPHRDNADVGESSSTASNRYGAISSVTTKIRKPKKVSSKSKVEAKVWFANERTWISWLRVSVLLGSFALALFNSSAFFENHGGDALGRQNLPNTGTIKAFGIVYAGIAVLTLLWGLFSYQRRVTLIKNRYPGDFDDLIGPPLICAALFVAVLFNFIVRVQQYNHEKAHSP